MFSHKINPQNAPGLRLLFFPEKNLDNAGLFGYKDSGIQVYRDTYMCVH